MQLGVFICEDCSEYFKTQCGGPGTEDCIIKGVFGEQEWDDSELRTIQLGGNKLVFELMLHNKMEQVPLIVNYNHPVMQEYRKQHMIKVFGEVEVVSADQQ